jgi:hypothetical protein
MVTPASFHGDETDDEDDEDDEDDDDDDDEEDGIDESSIVVPPSSLPRRSPKSPDDGIGTTDSADDCIDTIYDSLLLTNIIFTYDTLSYLRTLYVFTPN